MYFKIFLREIGYRDFTGYFCPQNQTRYEELLFNGLVQYLICIIMSISNMVIQLDVYTSLIPRRGVGKCSPFVDLFGATNLYWEVRFRI